MNRQPKKAAGTMRPMPVFGPKARWKAVAITSTDPVEFAREYENCMNSLVSDGWNITGMMPRGDAVVVTAQKPDLPQTVVRALAEMVEGSRSRRRPEGAVNEQIIYTYKDAEGVKNISCATLEEAVAYLEEHVREDGIILPISIVVMTATSYEPADLPDLRDMLK